MCFRLAFVLLLLSELQYSSTADVSHGHRGRVRKANRRHRATTDGVLRFEPEPYSKKFELGSSGKIHCKVAGGVTPTVQWFLNEKDPLPDGITSANGTLMVTEAKKIQAGNYSCHASDGDQIITARISLDVVVSPRVLEPTPGQQVHVTLGQTVSLNCLAVGDPPPTTHWDRNLSILHQQNGADIDESANSSMSRLVILSNGTLVIQNATEVDSDRYGCTAGSAAGLARNELELIVHPVGELPPAESTGVAGKAVLVSITVAGAYMILVLVLMLYCRRRRLQRRQRGEKLELEMAEGREKLVEEGEKKINGAAQNGRLLCDRESGADNSEVSGTSKTSKKSSQYDHLSVPKTLLTDIITLGRGEFGDVMLAKIDLAQIKKLRNKEDESESVMQPVLVKALTTKDNVQLSEFRRQLDLFSRVRDEHISRLLGLCTADEPHYMLLEHTDWGDLKTFLIATRTQEENEEYIARVGPGHGLPPTPTSIEPLAPAHKMALAAHLAAAASRLAHKRLTHRDIAARNCLITSSLTLKLSLPALTRGPHSHEYYKMHDTVIPLRWLPVEAVLEDEYSIKSDVYMYGATIWEIYTKAELPFAKLNDNSVLERLKSGSLDWNVPGSMPDKLQELLKRCWSKSPTDRPQFPEIFEEVNNMIKDLADNSSQHSAEREK
ncbi:tyrosine-protein kinase-like otk [Danaus plexippus]|uniref:tyrosine-protein kinase-like otk n=1 Tax=Danaus plexippus TaxID=13037 RepID=UPI002AB291AD|nr:tyrosine-protein kinase-like otk [Danaus plexippus]